MKWGLLVLAGLFEIGWAIGLKYTQGFSRFWPSVLTILSMVLSIGLLGSAMRVIPVGTAYAVWVGIGAIGTAALSMVLFNEPATTARLLSLSFILVGIIGLKVSMA